MDWVSSLAYSWKADGDLRTCLNPTHLNKTIRQNHYMTPLLEEITHELAGNTKFTKVDESSSYYCIVFEYESALLTTFNTHRGWFCFVCLLFRLACVQDIFQRLMDHILDNCDGVIGIAEDIIIHGKDGAWQETTQVHEGCKRTWTGTEQEEVWNKEQVFWMCLWQAQSPPRSIKGQCHQGDACPTEQRRASELPWNVNIYLSPFILQLSSHTATLRGLLKIDVEYIWNATYQVRFDKLKSSVCEDTTLRYFKMKKPVTIQIDASGKGLGAALI